MLAKTAVLTVRTTELVTDPEVAVIVVWPEEEEVAAPLAFTVATDGVEELQLTEAVRFCVVPSLKDPIAVNASVVPAAMLGLSGVTVRTMRTAGVTVRTVALLTEPAIAVIVAWPAEAPFATPIVVMVAIDGWEELQFTDVVRSCMLPSLKVPVALKG